MTVELRQRVVDEARTWIGTPYHALGGGLQSPGRNLKGVGIDCAQILIEVYSAVGVIDWYDTGRYADDWMLHNSEELYLKQIEWWADEYDWRHDGLLPGDVLCWRYGRTFSHGGIVAIANPLTVIHAFAPYRFVDETIVRGTILERVGRDLGERLHERPMRAFSPRGWR